ncbi:MFS transporter [bacterium]|nr:MFS transporter [bacterium]
MAHDSALDGVLGRLLGRASHDPAERRNLFWVTLAYLLNGAGATLFGGELWSGFLERTGFSLQEIGWISFAGLIATACGLFAFMGLGDRVRNRVRTACLVIGLLALAPLATVGVALIPRVALPLTGVFVALIAIGVSQALANSIPVMLDYPIWARAIAPGVRGRLFGFSNLSYGLPGILIGVFAAGLLKDMPYPMGYAWCFLAAAAAITVRAVTYSRVRELPDLAVAGASTSALPFASVARVLALKEFRWLAGPHIVRGLTMSVIGFSVPLGLKYLHMPEHYPGYATSATQIATVLAGIWVAVYADRWGAAWATLLGDVLYAVGMATVVLLGGNPAAFLVLYFLTQFGRNLEDNTVPLGAINLVPAEHLGAFSAARLMILMGSNAIGGPIFGWLFDGGHFVLVFALGALLKLLSGIWFWYVFRLKTPAHRAEMAGSALQRSDPDPDPAEGK